MNREDSSPTAVDAPWVGRPVLRVEDRAALTGITRYVDDLRAPEALHVAFCRSPIAAGIIRSIRPERAIATPGVHAVFTAQDLPDLGLTGAVDSPTFKPTVMPGLAIDVVRHVGEPIAMVLADSRYAAEDGVDELDLELDATQPVTTMLAARAPGAPTVHAGVPDNLFLEQMQYEDDEIDAVFEDPAAVVVEGDFSFARLAASPMEGRGCVAEWDERDERLTVHSSTQVPHLLRSTLASTLGLAESRVRVVAPDVGGGFGLKAAIGREDLLVAAAAIKLRTAVKWVEDRQENLAASFQAQEQRIRVRAAFAPDGTLLGIDGSMASDVGAYSVYPWTCGLEPMMAARELQGPYRLPRLRAHVTAVTTNKPPTAAYRGVARPQAAFAMERLMDKAARRLDMCRAEIRRTNLLRDGDFPYRGVNHMLYDSGSYLEALDRCLEELGYDGWPGRQAEARADGRLLGLGVACIAESTAPGTFGFSHQRMSVTPGYETAELRMEPSGDVVLAVGTSAHGQGHRTTLAQVVADRLGIDMDRVRVIQSDTDQAPYGWGTIASRSMVSAGGAAHRAAVSLREKIMRLGGHLLEAAPEDLEIRNGRVGVKGSPSHAVDVREVARLAYHTAHELPDGEEPGLAFRATFDPPGTHSNATHGAIVELDRETGAVRIDRYVVVEDCGVMINPLIVDGQVHGGVAQGIGKTLYEQLVYDEDGHCRSASFMDYLVPTAGEIPHIETIHLETPAETTETGAKGMGEGGIVGPPAAIANAVTDALQAQGVEIDALPIVAGEIFAAIGDPVPSR